MNCKKARTLLYDYTKDELGAGIKPAVELHISSCKACAAELASVNRVRSLFKTGLHEPGRGNLEAVRSAMKRPFEWLRGPKPVLALAATLLLVCGVFFANGMIESRKTLLNDFIEESYDVVDNAGTYVTEPVFLEDDLNNNEIF